MEKPKFLRLQLTEKNVSLYIDLLKSIKMPFKLEVSNYTTRITSERHNVYFMKGEQSNRAFAAASMLKSDLKGIVPPDIDMKKNNYYDTNFKGKEFYSDIAFNIDIKQAYANILFNKKYISKKTFLYLSRLPKMDRLAAVGMLASRKDVFEHDKNGNVKSHGEIINPLSNFFFYCVQETENIIHDIKNKILQNSFLFSWVDGIYYLNDNDSYREITQTYLLEEYGLKSTFKKLTNFEVKIKNKDYYQITFKEEPEKEKVFNIPFPETQIKKQIIDYLLNKKY